MDNSKIVAIIGVFVASAPFYMEIASAPLRTFLFAGGLMIIIFADKITVAGKGKK